MAGVDAQMDAVFREILAISFEVADVPLSAFMTADEAWRRCRRGEYSPGEFGHGAARGLWFLRVNVVRDHLALNGRETSPWDGWRSALGSYETLSEAEIAATDLIADATEAPDQPQPAPSWLSVVST